MIHAQNLACPVQSLMEVTERPEIVFGKGLGRGVPLAALCAGARPVARAGSGLVVTYARDVLQKHPGWEDTGLLLNSPRPDAIRLMPALDVTRAEIDRMIEGLRIAIDAVR